MKNLLRILTVLALIFATSTMDAQRSRGGDGDSGSGQDKAIKIGPFGFVLGFYNATFEKKIKDKASFVVGARFATFDLNSNDYTSIGLNGQYRIYFKEAISGPYLAPSLSLGFNNTTVLDQDESFANLGLGANIGWQWVFGGGFVMDLGIGARYRNGFGDDVDADFGGVGPAFQFQIGYAF